MEFEKHTDPIDVASRNEAIATEDSIRTTRLRAIPQQQKKSRVINGVEEHYFEITDCIECGNPIGEKRLEVAVKNYYCIHCATAQEKGPK